MGWHVFQAGLRLTVQPKMRLNFCLHPISMRITDVCHQTWYTWCWRLKPGPPVCWANHLPAELHSQDCPPPLDSFLMEKLMMTSPCWCCYYFIFSLLRSEYVTYSSQNREGKWVELFKPVLKHWRKAASRTQLTEVEPVGELERGLCKHQDEDM